MSFCKPRQKQIHLPVVGNGIASDASNVGEKNSRSRTLFLFLRVSPLLRASRTERIVPPQQSPTTSKNDRKEMRQFRFCPFFAHMEASQGWKKIGVAIVPCWGFFGYALLSCKHSRKAARKKSRQKKRKAALRIAAQAIDAAWWFLSEKPPCTLNGKIPSPFSSRRQVTVQNKTLR